MSSAWTEEYANDYGLVSAKVTYATNVITVSIVGIQFFMNCYALIVFFETTSERRQGRALYLISGWLIFAFYTMGACSDMSRMFKILLEAVNGLDYMQIYSSTALWMDSLSVSSVCLVFIIGDGLLLYRCSLLLAGGWCWVLALPLLMYLSVIALSIVNVVMLFPYSESMEDTLSNVTLSCDILAFTTNLFITSVLCYQLWSSHRKLARSMPSAGKRLVVYQTAIRILVESALPLAIAGILKAAISYVPIVAGNISRYSGDPKALEVAYACSELLYYGLQALAPQLIIFRVTTGRSWTKTDKSSAEAFSRSLAFYQGPQPDESPITRDDEEIAEEPHGPNRDVSFVNSQFPDKLLSADI
ncbi:hypothetical protein FA15DRAFT_708773 [Coprinopsis marcescibilis]|uniref:Uncharacterized protein n=1 Tax=Coprinopsis marcescibilis TaxID=230819 RepID=A0A5C3KI25_COPMA|nr:hypothetical protein FA15DRAFT_708773 [Coprinopsis marcescibilis]